MKKVRRVVKRKENSPIREVSELTQPHKQQILLTANFESLNSRFQNLTQIYQTLKSFESKKSANSRLLSHTSFLIQSIEPVLSAYLYQVSKRASEQNEKLLEFVNNNNISKELSILTRQILSILLFLSNIHSTLMLAMSNEDENVSNVSQKSDATPTETETPTNQNLAETDKLPLKKNLSNEEIKNFITDDDEEDLTVLCRICEKRIPLDLVDKHTNLCIQAHQEKYNIINSDNQLESINQQLATILAVNWPGNANEAIKILYPLLYLYLSNEIAINFKSFQNEDINNLDSICQKLKNIKIPKTVEKYTVYFDQSLHLIKLLVECANIIVKKTQEIAKTTVDHSVGDVMKQAKLSDFQFLCQLSAGAFARVYLAKKETTGDLYAVKVITQSRLNLKNQVRRVATERDIMMKLHSPYMVNFYYSFMPKNNLYLVMEYIPGGDIYSLLQNMGSLDEDNARVYVVQVVKALQFLRQNNIIHCDLKPDNILIDSNGYLRLTDFGLSFDGQNGRQLSNLVGTPDYMAPEIILMQKHNFSCDYWSLGVMIYEMLYGAPPFHGQTEEETFQKILSAEYDLGILDDVSDECKDFITKLLISDPQKRIGANRFEDIMEHKWFEGINWDDVLSMEPVFVPDMEQIEESRDIYFQSRYQFTDASEKDIREDLEIDRQPEEPEQPTPVVQKTCSSHSGTPRMRSSSLRKDISRRDETKNDSNPNSPNLPIRPLPPRNDNGSKKVNNSPMPKEDTITSPIVENTVQENAEEGDASAPKIPESSSKLQDDFQKISLQHLRTINEGESIRLSRKRSRTLTRDSRPNLIDLDLPKDEVKNTENSEQQMELPKQQSCTNLHQHIQADSQNQETEPVGNNQEEKDISKCSSLTKPPEKINEDSLPKAQISNRKSSGSLELGAAEKPSQGKSPKQYQRVLPRMPAQPQKIPFMKFHNVLAGNSANKLKQNLHNLAVPTVPSNHAKILFTSQTSITTHRAVINNNRPNLAIPKNVEINSNLLAIKKGDMHSSSSFSNLTRTDQPDKLFTSSDDKNNTSDTSDEKFESSLKPLTIPSVPPVETKSGRLVKAPLPPIPQHSVNDLPSYANNNNSLLIHNETMLK